MKLVVGGIDCGLRTGYAVGLIEGGELELLESGWADFASPSRRESMGVRFLRFRAWLVDFVRSLRKVAEGYGATPLVVVEAPHQRGQAATMYGVGFVTRVAEVCEELGGIEWEAVHSSTLKRVATGKGSASKSEMVRWASEVRGEVDPCEENEADAIACVRYAAVCYGDGKARRDDRRVGS